jgi:argininosuccinate synthase
MAKVALAYSGSLDTTICVYYLRAIRGLKVFSFSANLGQAEDLQPLVEKALQLGATAAHIADLRDKFAQEYVLPCVRAQAVYEGGYHLFSAISRPLIVEELVHIAREEGCEYVAHGSRGIGNDLIRFQNGIRALAPDLKAIAPLEEIKLASPEMDVEYARKHNIRFGEPSKTLYNIEQNLWGVNIQMPHDKAWPAPPANTYVWTSPLGETPANEDVLEVEFESGNPVKIDGRPLAPVALIEELNQRGGRAGVGRYDVIENRILGRKTREIYEAPAADILLAAHAALETLVLDKETLHFKPLLSQKYAELAYEGRWFSPLRSSLDDFFSRINSRVTGTVRLGLLHGNVTIQRLESPHSLLEIRRP